jgi:hypothetical protein
LDPAPAHDQDVTWAGPIARQTLPFGNLLKVGCRYR